MRLISEARSSRSIQSPLLRWVGIACGPQLALGPVPPAERIGEQARVRGEIRTKSVNVRGTVDGNIFVTERCELQANCTVRGDIEAPRLVVSENATFLGSAKVGTGKSLPA